jgi:hypothetical protein
VGIQILDIQNLENFKYRTNWLPEFEWSHIIMPGPSGPTIGTLNQFLNGLEPLVWNGGRSFEFHASFEWQKTVQTKLGLCIYPGHLVLFPNGLVIRCYY